ncbi:MAG: hypothetical protein A2Z25_10265 [Planctomycetes bacterium RBG_16_55_9]|nr:MAG: hypothetical protein A2Z25_10265 [Planctomycetes bacterium RBG_16_55_9]
MRTKSMILGSILLLVGSVALLWGLTEIRRQQEEITRCQSRYVTQTDDYMKQYNEWLLRPADEKPAFPLLLDKDGKTKTAAQLKQEQRERLTADLDKLASGRTDVHPFADVLYGENWPSEIEAYKKQKELNESVLIGSIVCTSLGGSIFVWWMLVWIWRMMGGVLAGVRARSDAVRRSREMPLPLRAHYEQPSEMVDEPADVPPSTENPAAEQESSAQYSQRLKQPKVLPNSRWGHWTPAQPDPQVNAEASEIKRISEEVERIASLLSDEKTTRAAVLEARPLEARDHPKPLDGALKQLSEEVSAIREYTAYQQDRLEKLQDGYDWNIIRTFCLRVIRCIDNLDNRISQLSSKNGKTAHLTEVRDELIFALESSGVEQFAPQINSDYRGQEKVAEAVKDRQPCEDSEHKGKIAGVIRPGYQYFISEENIKVVRPAQVRLFA